MLIKRLIGWMLVYLGILATYIASSLSLPDPYSFPRDGILRWLPQMSRWFALPTAILLIIVFILIVWIGASSLGWCFLPKETSYKSCLLFWRD